MGKTLFQILKRTPSKHNIYSVLTEFNVDGFSLVQICELANICKDVSGLWPKCLTGNGMSLIALCLLLPSVPHLLAEIYCTQAAGTCSVGYCKHVSVCLHYGAHTKLRDILTLTYSCLHADFMVLLFACKPNPKWAKQKSATCCYATRAFLWFLSPEASSPSLTRYWSTTRKSLWSFQS